MQACMQGTILPTVIPHPPWDGKTWTTWIQMMTNPKPSNRESKLMWWLHSRSLGIESLNFVVLQRLSHFIALCLPSPATIVSLFQSSKYHSFSHLNSPLLGPNSLKALSLKLVVPQGQNETLSGQGGNVVVNIENNNVVVDGETSKILHEFPLPHWARPLSYCKFHFHSYYLHLLLPAFLLLCKHLHFAFHLLSKALSISNSMCDTDFHHGRCCGWPFYCGGAHSCLIFWSSISMAPTMSVRHLANSMEEHKKCI